MLSTLITFTRACVVSLAFVATSMAEPVTIRWVTNAAPFAVEVDGIARDALQALESDVREAGEWSRVFAVYTAAGAFIGETSLPPMAGAWRVVNGKLRFEPQFPLVQGVRYRAEFRPAGVSPIHSYFELPAQKQGRATQILQVFPSAGVLPENQLKFYVHFSAPMSRGGTYEHVHIRDSGGRVIDLPFLELDEELWDPAMTRLTLLIDPGRIKRGVKPLEDIGPVFENGREYSLTLEATCRDAAGHPLRQSFEKKFRIGAADRTPPDPQRWKIEAPTAGTRGPLTVEFDEPMDQALALRLIRVMSDLGVNGAIRGDAKLDRNEQSWAFTPEGPWTRGIYQLRVATTIEDLAGNNIGKTFDVDLSAGAQRRATGESISIRFEVR